MRVILDTNVVVAAVRSRSGASAKLLELLPAGVYSIVLSAPLALEYEEVLVRELVPAFASLADVDMLIRFLCEVAEKYDPGHERRPALPDADDDFIVDLYAEAKVDCVVTHNTRDFAALAAGGVTVITPARFLQMLRGSP